LQRFTGVQDMFLVSVWFRSPHFHLLQNRGDVRRERHRFA
jgi:hypothetical protein